MSHIPDLDYLTHLTQIDLYDILDKSMSTRCSCEVCFLVRQFKDQAISAILDNRKRTERLQIPIKKTRPVGRPTEKRTKMGTYASDKEIRAAKILKEDLERTQQEIKTAQKIDLERKAAAKRGLQIEIEARKFLQEKREQEKEQKKKKKKQEAADAEGVEVGRV